MAFSGVVLTGGESTRMGTDKAFVTVEGQPMAGRVAAALHDAGASEVLAVGGDLDRLAGAGLDARPDPRQGTGPLGGLLSAFAVVRQPAVVVLATDLAWIDVPTITSLVVALTDGVDAAVARTGHWEPLCAAWRVASCQPELASAFAAGERAVHRAMVPLRIAAVAVDPRAVRNVNTPDDVNR